MWYFISLVKFIPRYFILFVVIVNGIVFLSSLSASFFFCLFVCLFLRKISPKLTSAANPPLFAEIVNGIVFFTSLSVSL